MLLSDFAWNYLTCPDDLEKVSNFLLKALNHIPKEDLFPYEEMVVDQIEILLYLYQQQNKKLEEIQF